jgi:tRNA(Arg) A34 adenosine deaminase TadA
MNFYMEQCLKLASYAASKGEVPVGAIIFDSIENKIIARASNCCEALGNSLKHAEMLVIDKACKKRKSKNLSGCHIYVTLEPCGMCATAISYARISRIYYGATDKKFGAIESGPRIFNSTSSLFKPDIYGGIMSEECQNLLKDFFKPLRRENTEPKPLY